MIRPRLRPLEAALAGPALSGSESGRRRRLRGRGKHGHRDGGSAAAAAGPGRRRCRGPAAMHGVSPTESDGPRLATVICRGTVTRVSVTLSTVTLLVTSD